MNNLALQRPSGPFSFVPLLFGVVGLVLVVQHFRARTVVSFEVSVIEAAPGDMLFPCFYYDTGSGFSETEKVCFDYDRRSKSKFHSYRITLPTRSAIRQLRFDPLDGAGVVALRNVVISRCRFDMGGDRLNKLNLTEELGKTLFPLHESVLSAQGDTLLARLTGYDPYFILMANGLRRRAVLGLRALLQACVLALIISTALLPFYAFLQWTGFWSRIPKYREVLGSYARPWLELARPAALAGLTAFGVTTIIAKVFAIFTSVFRYGRSISLANLLAAPAESVAVVLFAAIAVAVAITADRFCAGYKRAAPIRALLAGLQFVIALSLVGLALFEILCSYVFWEWGSYIDGSLIILAYQSPTPDSVRYYLTRAPAAIAALGVVAMLVVGGLAFRLFRRREIPKRFVVAFASVAAIWSLGALSPLRAPYAYDPSVSSPILLALRTGPDLSGGLDPSITAPDLASFHLPMPRPVPVAYRHYHGAAAGQDIIFVVLESVRRADVSLYGYSRETTPILSRLANHAMVFSNVYVAQPRSGKTMEAFSLGTYPDPRIETLNSSPDRIIGHPTFWGTLANHGYTGYVGVNADPDSDSFAPLMKASWGPALDKITGKADLIAKYGAAARPPGTMGSDRVLVDDFLQWYGAQKGPAAAVVWFAGAHHPYWAATKRFAENDAVDRYDNCIFASDAAVGHMIEGIEKTGRHPLVLIFGDHGEAFGEHAGDQLHGSYLYNQSVRIPMLLYSPTLFPERQDFDGRISMKDVPATLLYLLGFDESLGQSEVAFSKEPDDPVYMSNVYGDFKLGMVEGSGPEKFMYLPTKNSSYLFDLSVDPEERNNLVAAQSSGDILRRKQELIRWYYYQIRYLDQAFPRHTEAASAETPVTR